MNLFLVRTESNKRISRSDKKLPPHSAYLETRNNRDFGDALIRAVFDEVSGAI
jgi:hypothetical protein